MSVKPLENREELKKELKKVFDEHGIILSNGYMNGYQYLKKLRIESLQNDKSLTEDDVFKKHILLERFFKKNITKEEAGTSFYQLEGSMEEVLENIVEELEGDGEGILYFFFDDGQEYGFNDGDGFIEVQHALVESEFWYDVYAYYAYIGK